MTTKIPHSFARDFFNEISPLSEKSFAELKPIFIPVFIKKDEVFINVGKENHSEYMVVNGYCRSFLLNPDGEEITLSFFKPKMALSPHIIRTKNRLSLLNFQALTDLEVVVFNANSFLSLMIDNMEIRNLGNAILVNELASKTEKEIALASLTAKERLMQFRNEYLILENLIAHPIIASYLGITNVSLSRIRSEIARE